MKINSRKILITSLAMIVMMVAILFGVVAISPLTAYAAGDGLSEETAMEVNDYTSFKAATTIKGRTC